MRVVLLHNDKAGKSGCSKKEVTALVREAGFDPLYVPMKQAEVEPEVLERGEFVIVAGGDGSIRRAALLLLGRHRMLAPLPLGTANNIARSLGLHHKPRHIVEGWHRPERKPFDVGQIKGLWGQRYFIEGVGVGLISRSIAVIEDIDEIAAYELKKPKHKLHRDACVAAALAHEMQPLKARLTLDRRNSSNEFLLLEVLNINRAGPAVELAPRADPSDGRFDVVTATANQREHLMRALRARLRDGPRVRNLTTRRARHIKLKLRTPGDFRVDDATLRVEADTEVDISIHHGALEFLLPGEK